MEKIFKKLFCILSGIFLICFFVACNKNGGENPPVEPPAESEVNVKDDFTVTSNILVVYFSKTNTTENVALRIQELTNADVFEVERKEPYPDEYTPTTEVAKEEKEANARPELKTYLPREVVERYDTIFIGFPIWWHTAPMPILSFLNFYDLNGKTIYTFCTAASSPISESTADIRSNAQGATVIEGKKFTRNDNTIESWVYSLNLVQKPIESEKPATTYYTVTFDSNGGSNVENVTVEKGSLVPRPEMPERESYDFMGWYTEDNVKWSFRNKIEKNMVLTAQRQNHMTEVTANLIFNASGDTVTGITGDVPHVVIPKENHGVPVTKIAESAFAYSRHTDDIYSITIPDSITEIERNAFYSRSELSYVNIGENSRLITIGNHAFSGNSALQSIYIPAGVSSIGDGAFNNDSAIEFTVAEDNATYRSENGHLIEKERNILIRGGQNSIVPEGITVIEQAAFRNSRLTELSIPLTVVTIGNYVIGNSSIAVINFAGSEAEWNEIEKGRLWNSGNRDVEVKFITFEPKILIAYFSWSGTTTRLAQHVQTMIPNATMYQIERVTPYSNNYNDVAYGEAKDEADNNARPPVKNLLSEDEMKKYDAIIVMYPIWWHTAPMVVGTFLETYDLSGVNIYPITQSASMDTSQFDESFQFIKTCANKKGTPTVYTGLGTKDNSVIDNYLRLNGLIA